MEAGSLLSKRFLAAISIITALCLLMFGFRIAATGTFRYWFIPENLALAWLAMLSSWLLVVELGRHRWLSWQNLVLSVIWLFFLPNTWYVMTDFLHVYPTGEISQLFDIAMMTSLVICGFSLGFASLYLLHMEFLKRLTERAAHLAVAAVLLISSFGIYLGRDLRWNTWDVVANPGGIILNVSDRVIDPFGHPRAINVTLLLFVMLSALYAALWLMTGPHKVKRR
ncbi:MAG TPA: DUF1361 domain-containing protein [Candidatus Saccharimonadales bacterium]|nr:DUF1361 domain-containing protein [Candidatus Saccharimonadales bacterium]